VLRSEVVKTPTEVRSSFDRNADEQHIAIKAIHR
jgi:hypothetical protein